MKKQFFRVKQLADQTFSRAGKTEVLSDDLQNADRKVDYIRTACHKTSKSLSSGLSTQGQDPAAKEKRLKKYPEHCLGVAMGESSSSADDFLLRQILAKCSKVQLELANEAFNHEVDVECKVVTPLNEIIDNEANIMKYKRNLQKLILDMDSAKARYITAKKQTGDHRAESIREEMEDAELKVEQCRDALASEMFVLISKEAQLAQSVVLYVKLQKEYHRSALLILEERFPELQQDIEDSPSKPVYGCNLEEHLRVTHRDIAFPIELCVCALLEFGIQEEGLFRVAGGTSKVKRMKHSFDACCLSLPIARGYGDPHVIASALKSYLRELPDPLLTKHLYEEWMSAAKIPDPDARLQALWMVLHKLPSDNFANLRYLIKFLAKLTESQSINKMTPQNIAIVIAPNLIWSMTEETNMGMNMNMANMYSSIVETLISHSDDYFFKGEIEFYVTMQRPEARESNERLHLNGMSKSVGPVTITAQDDMDYYGHKRSNSNDTTNISFGESNEMKRTQSNSSLSDSPPHGSPKPATRRKNKPAPVPPNNLDKPPRPATNPIVLSTLPRPAKKPLCDETRSASTPVVESTKLIAAEKQTKAEHFLAQERHNPLRRSLDYDHNAAIKLQENLQAKFTKSQELDVAKPVRKETDTLINLMDHEFPKPAKPQTADNKPWKQQDPSKEDAPAKLLDGAEESNIAKSDANHPSSTILIPTTVNSSPTFKVTVNQEQKISGAPFQISGSSTLDRKRLHRTAVVPVAAPRTVLDNKATDEAAAKEESEGVRLRRVSVEGDRATKPAIPERPSALQRPTSVGGAKTPRNSAELEALPDSERPSLERIHMYCVDKQQVSIIQVGGEREKTGDEAEPESAQADVKAERPERPPKPDNIPTVAVRPVAPSHQRTLSEGNLIDACISDQPRVGPHRPPRPQPPPPPPPVKPRGEGAASESTDL